jgi:hypothetical protein
MARVRFAEIIGVVAVAGSLAACGGTSKSASAPVTVTSTVQAAPASPATSTPVSGAGSTTAASATTAPSTLPSTQPPTKSSSTSASGGGTSTGGQVAILGTLQYLAPGKFIVHPADGSMDQAFYVADDTQILGAAAICGPADGTVTIGADGYGTSKCTADQLETASKTNAVKVRVTMDRKTGTVSKVEEKYHP